MIWHSSSPDDVLMELDTDENCGLSGAEVKKRIEKYGLNQIFSGRRKSFWQLVGTQFKNTSVLVLLIVSALTLLVAVALGNGTVSWVQPLLILIFVVTQIFICAALEYHSQNTLMAIKRMSAPTATVIRSSKHKKVPATELVPGDIIVLNDGDYIPADARIIIADALRCNESTLTGEIVPVEKSADTINEDLTPVSGRYNMVYCGCSVVNGSAVAVVTDTGPDTECGKISNMIDNSPKETPPLQEKINSVQKTVGQFGVAVGAIIFILSFLLQLTSGNSFLVIGINSLLIAVTVVAALVPHGLLSLITTAYSHGLKRMSENDIIVRDLSSVSTLGKVSAICSNMSGTLTRGEMAAVKVFAENNIVSLQKENISPEIAMLLRLATMCNDAKITVNKKGKVKYSGSATDIGIAKACKRYAGISKTDIDNMYARISEIPFDADRKLLTTVNMIDGRAYAIVSGAPDTLISKCNRGAENALQANEALCNEGLRVIAIGMKPLPDLSDTSNPTPEQVENELKFVGMIALLDPPREDVVNAIRKCRYAGITPVLVTGDHITTACSVARQLGILNDDGQAVSGDVLAQMSDEELAENIGNYTVFARITSEDKLRIVNALQAGGKSVVLTGDGVSDAPALKAANVGCALSGSGTDVAKGAAGINLKDDNFATIISAIELSRSMSDNIRKVTQFLLGCGIGEAALVVLSTAIFKTSIISPALLMLFNLLIAILPAAAIGTAAPEYNTMYSEPADYEKHLFTSRQNIDFAWHGAVIAVVTILSYVIGRGSVGLSMAFATMSFALIFYSFSAGCDAMILKSDLKASRRIILAASLSIIAVLLVMLTPIRFLFGIELFSFGKWLAVLGLASIPTVAYEAVKTVRGIISK